MGYFSDLAISMNEGPNITERDTFVCKDCVVDEVLAALVEENLESKVCSYCGIDSKKPLAASFNIVMERIHESILTEYADAQDINMPYVEGGWLFEETYPSDVVGSFDPGWQGDFLDDVINSLDPMVYWVEHSNGDWGIANPGWTFRFGWDSFKDQILTKTRYLILSEPEDENDMGRPDYLPVSRVLDALGYIFNETCNVFVQPENSLFYRVRAASDHDDFSSIEDLGVPPVGVASGGRMNPAGISYLYVALDEETAIAEVINRNTAFYVGTFRSKKPLKLIDFVNLPEIPSLFEPALYDRRHSISFLHNLRNDLVKPVQKDGKEHIEYIPTQVISEYFRYRYRDKNGESVNGMIYPSVKNNSGVNIVIFESNNTDIESFLELVDIKKKC